ncbi:MAG: Gfo/Idh/MocA family oxidoreductase [Anaerolineaceae bacterium]|nr:Gfo/Idh/MocA family oxidoreductase [Anaerolineaceae bacterium]
MDRIKIGFIGCGRHATKVLYPSLRYVPIDLTAVCDLDENLVRRNAHWFGATSQFTDYKDMLDKCQLDGVVIVTGPKSHAEIANNVIQRGVPVFMEKPPAYTLSEAEKLLDKSEKSGVHITVGMMKRWTPVYQRVKEIISAKEFGKTSHVQAMFRVGQKHCSGYALLLDAGIHILDLVRFLGGDVVSIQGEKYQSEMGIAYAINLRFENGAVGNVHVSDQGSWSCANEAIEITGNGAFVRAENLINLRVTKKDGSTICWEPGFSIPQNQNNSLFVQGYVPQFEAWAQAVLTKTKPKSTIAETCHAMRLIKTLEPGEEYIKKPMQFAHWQAEEAWLKGFEDNLKGIEG